MARMRIRLRAVSPWYAHVSSYFSPVRFEERSSCHQLSQNSSETLFPNHRKQECAVVLKLFRRGKGIVKVIHCKWRFTQTREQWFTSKMTQLWEPGLDSLRHKHFWPPVARTSKEAIVTSTLISVKKTAPASLFFQRVFGCYQWCQMNVILMGCTYLSFKSIGKIVCDLYIQYYINLVFVLWLHAWLKVSTIFHVDVRMWWLMPCWVQRNIKWGSV